MEILMVKSENSKPGLSCSEIVAMIKDYHAIIVEAFPKSRHDPKSLIFVYSLGDNQELKQSLGYIGDDTELTITRKHGIKVFFFSMEYEKMSILLKAVDYKLVSFNEEVKI